jgi:MFS family permease
MAATVMANLVMPIHFITLTFWAVDTYPGQKVLFPALLIAARGLGMVSLGLVGGAIADRFERRKVLRVTEALSLVTTALIALSMLVEPLGDGTIVLVLLLVILASANMGIDQPARSASMPAIVGPAEMGAAIALNSVAMQLTFPIMFPLVGYLNGRFEAGQVMALSTAAWAVSIPLIWLLRYSTRGGPAAARRNMTHEIAEGLRYARRDGVVLAVLGMMVVLQVVGMPGVGMLGAVWMTEVLDLSRAQFGLIGTLWGAGAVTASFFFAAYSQVTRRGTWLAAMVVLFGLASIAFGHSRIIPVTAVANFCLGFAMAGTMVTSMTMVQYAVREDVRGRVLGLFPLVMGGSMVNAFFVGLAGQELGLEVVVPALAWATLALGAAIVLVSPALRGGGGGGRREAREPEPEPVLAGGPVAVAEPPAASL